MLYYTTGSHEINAANLLPDVVPIRSRYKTGISAAAAAARSAIIKLMFLILLMPCIVPTAVGQFPTKSVNRLNYGMYFKHEKSIKQAVGRWHHSFVVNLPDLDFVSKSFAAPAENTNSRPLPKLSLLAAAHHTPKSFASDNKMFMQNFKWLHNLSQDGIDTLRILETAIFDIIPTHSFNFTQSKNKRAVFDFLKGPIKFLFGSVSEDELEILQKQVLQIAKAQNNQLNLLQKSTKDLNSFVHTTNSRLNS